MRTPVWNVHYARPGRFDDASCVKLRRKFAAKRAYVHGKGESAVYDFHHSVARHVRYPSLEPKRLAVEPFLEDRLARREVFEQFAERRIPHGFHRRVAHQPRDRQFQQRLDFAAGNDGDFVGFAVGKVENIRLTGQGFLKQFCE